MQASPPYGLPPHTLAVIISVLAQYPAIQSAIIYGSRAKGNYRPNSDIDLTLHAPGLSWQDQTRLEDALDDLLLPYKIDLSLYHQLTNPDLIAQIQQHGIVCYRASDK